WKAILVRDYFSDVVIPAESGVRVAGHSRCAFRVDVGNIPGGVLRRKSTARRVDDLSAPAMRCSYNVLFRVGECGRRRRPDAFADSQMEATDILEPAPDHATFTKKSYLGSCNRVRRGCPSRQGGARGIHSNRS